MVTGDVDYRNLKRNPARRSSDAPWVRRLASPADRLAAWVADLVIFAPVLTLIVAPLRRHATEAQMLGNEQAWLVALLGMGALAAAMMVLYHAFFLALWGATPGKRFLGLRVVPVWNSDEALRPATGLIRAAALMFEALCLGIPLLAIFGNERRRPLHDRIADTVVITTRPGRAAGRASLGEMSMASGFLLAFFVAIAFVTSAQLIHLLRSHDDESDRQVARLEEAGHLCKKVGKAARSWVPERGATRPSRLDVALTLFAASEVESECLEAEADYALWRSLEPGAQAEAYLARGLSEAENTPQSEAYLKKTCEAGPNSDACKVVKLMEIVDALNDDDADDVKSADAAAARAERERETTALVDQVTEKSSPYLQVWMSEYLMQTAQYSRALTLIEGLSHEETLSHFVLSARGQALWHLGQLTEARILSSTVGSEAWNSRDLKSRPH